MKKLLCSLWIGLSIISLLSCQKMDGNFSIIGSWGMVSGTITDGDGTTKRYDRLGANTYYQTLEFRTDGTLIKTTYPDKSIKFGVYSYNDATKELPYKYDGDKYYYSATINIISVTEIIITTDYGPDLGKITQYMIKLN